MQQEIVVVGFAGGGGSCEGIKEAIGRSPHVAINHDEVAVAVHRANHPDTIHYCRNIYKADPMEVLRDVQKKHKLPALPKIGMGWFSPDCFPAGTLVLTDQGYRAIETIREGDTVLTHQLRWRRVTAAMRSHKPLLTLRGHGHPGLRVSPEHPFYARQRSVSWVNAKRQYIPQLSEPGWVSASLLGPGEYRYKSPGGRRGLLEGGWYWGSPTTFPALPIPSVGGRGFALNADLMWLAGRYVGDGWTRLTNERAELVITCGRKEVPKLRTLLARWPRTGARAQDSELSWTERETSTAYQFATNHRGLVTWLRENFGHRAEAKSLPAWALGMCKEYRDALLQGYLSADGHFGAVTQCDTVSKALAFSVKALAATFGLSVSVYLAENCNVIEGRKVNARPIYSVRWRAAPQRKQAFVDANVEIEWTAVRERSEVNFVDEEVFNISVEEDESYIIEGIIVHNCTHHSRARGGKPRQKNIRDLPWVILAWAKLPAHLRPRLFFIENVTEYLDWGPLDADGHPIPDRKGESFNRWVGEFRRRGYKVEWRKIKAANKKTPTTRERLYIIMRNDGLPILWPEDQCAAPKSPYVISGKREPWPTAAECIDWSLPCPSIFDTSEQIKEKFGLRAIRPLADNTQARIARGVWRYVIDCAEPFIIPVTHTGDIRVHSTRDPLRTSTATHRGEHALVTPFVTKFNRGATGSDLRDPMPVNTAAYSDYHPGGAAPLGIVTPFLSRQFGASTGSPADGPAPTAMPGGGGKTAVIAPVLVKNYHGDRPDYSPLEPAKTILTGQHHMLVAPTLIQTGYGERPGQAPRILDLQAPLGATVDGQKHGLVEAQLEPAPSFEEWFAATEGLGGSREEYDMLYGPRTAAHDRNHVLADRVAAFLAQHNYMEPGHDAREPMSTIVQRGCTQAVVAAYLAQHNGDGHTGHHATEPLSTIMSSGHQQAIVSAGLMSLKGEERRGGPITMPVPGICAQGNHIAEVRAFLMKFHRDGGQLQGADVPFGAIPTHDSFGLVTVWIGGEPFIIVDIGMRMLTPRELFTANGMRRDYIIDRGIWPDGTWKPITKTQQVRLCGNMVCPPVARCLVAANYEPQMVNKRGVPAFALEAAE